ncbi:MAG: hypothetical protein WA705_06455 [Candidatus Ozemobacteraceae bacterium]
MSGQVFDQFNFFLHKLVHIRQLSSNDQAGKTIPVLEKVNMRLSELRQARTKSFFRREQGVKS